MGFFTQENEGNQNENAGKTERVKE